MNTQAAVNYRHSAKDILKTKGIIHFFESQPLSKALASLSSSHDAAFIFDQADVFVGVISPHYLFSNRSYKDSMKLKSCAKTPPKIYLTTPLPVIAQAMIESKIHYLPVFDDKEAFAGIATIRRLLEYSVSQHLTNHHGHIVFTDRTLVTARDDMSVGQIVNLMKTHKVAKIPIVDRQGHLKGIVSQYDLTKTLETPQRIGRGDRAGNKNKQSEFPIKDYMETFIYTMDRLPTFSQAVQYMHEKNIGSIVIVDNEQRPIGIVTKRDLLRTVASASSSMI